MEIWTAGTGAPDSSLTVPVIDPSANCALVVERESDMKAAIATTKASIFPTAFKPSLACELCQTIVRPEGMVFTLIDELTTRQHTRMSLTIHRPQFLDLRCITDA